MYNNIYVFQLSEPKIAKKYVKTGFGANFGPLQLLK